MKSEEEMSSTLNEYANPTFESKAGCITFLIIIAVVIIVLLFGD